MDTKQLVGVLVTTEHKGVFFGYVPEGTKDAEGEITLQRARNCVYWSIDVKGVFGLAATGPSKGCRIGPSVPSLLLKGVTSIAEVTPEAVTNWEASKWA